MAREQGIAAVEAAFRVESADAFDRASEESGERAGSAAPAVTLAADKEAAPKPRLKRAAVLPAGLHATPANDDLLSGVEESPAAGDRPRTAAAMVLAFVFSLAWLALCGAYVYFKEGRGNPAALLSGEFWAGRESTAAIVALAPPLAFLLLGAVAKVLIELRWSATSIRQSARRLALPERAAGREIGDLSQAIRREIASMTEDIERAVARASDLETKLRAEAGELQRVYTENERRQKLLIAEMVDHREILAARGDSLNASIATACEAAERNVGMAFDRLRAFEDRLSSSAPAAISELGKYTDAVSQQLDRAVSLFSRDEDGLLNSVNTAVAALDQRLSEIKAFDPVVYGSFEGSLTACVKDIETRLEIAVARFAQTLNNSGDEGFARIRDEGRATIADVEDRMNGLHGAVGNLAMNLDQQLSERSGELANAFEINMRSMNDRVGGLIQEIGDGLGEIGERVGSGLVARGQRAREDFVRRMIEVISEFDSVGRILLSNASAQGDEAVTLLQDRAESVASSVARQVERLKQEVVEPLAAIHRDIEARGGELAERLAAQSSDLDRLMDEHRQAVASAMDDHVGAIARGIKLQSATINDAFALGTHKFAQTAENATSSLRLVVDQSNNGQVDAIGKLGQDLGHEFERSTKALGETVERVATPAVAAIDTAAERVRREMGQMLDRFSQIGTALELTARSEGLRLHALESALSERIQKFHQAVDSMSHHIVRLSNASASAQDDARNLMERLADPRRQSGAARLSADQAPSGTRSAPARSDWEPSRQGVEPSAAPGTSEPPRVLERASVATPDPAPRSEQGERRPSPRPAPTLPAGNSPRIDRGNANWLSNLLAAASREDVSMSERTAELSFGNDRDKRAVAAIVSEIDATAVARMWDRLRSGEILDVSADIYKPAGRVLAGELRQRYGRDGDFSRMVDNYVEEFELILDKLSDRDEDGALLRSCLLSDAGKLYAALLDVAGQKSHPVTRAKPYQAAKKQAEAPAGTRNGAAREKRER